MPTKYAVGPADIDFVRLGIPKRLHRAGIIEAFWELQRKIRYGGLSRRQRWLHRFDPSVTDLSTMPIGLFEAKAIILPRKHLPRSKEALRSFCRQLIDRGENERYIEIVHRGWGDGWSLERHVDLLWGLRERHRSFFEDVVRSARPRSRQAGRCRGRKRPDGGGWAQPRPSAGPAVVRDGRPDGDLRRASQHGHAVRPSGSYVDESFQSGHGHALDAPGAWSPRGCLRPVSDD
jgi:hypothetical protein